MIITRARLWVGYLLMLTVGASRARAQEAPFRPPAFPLVALDPYLSLWMQDEVPTRAEAVHWSQSPVPVRSLVSLDGKVYRLMGKAPGFVPAARTTSAQVTPTRTLFRYTQDGVELELAFLTPTLPENLDLVSRPVTYVLWRLTAKDGKPHDVSIYFDISGLATVNDHDQAVTWQERQLHGLTVLRMGSATQAVLAKSGDERRIDWGHLFVAAPTAMHRGVFAGKSEASLMAFAEGKPLPKTGAEGQGVAAKEVRPVMAFELPLALSATKPAEAHVTLAYDDIFSVELLGQRLEGYWKTKFFGIESLLLASEAERPAIEARCEAYDRELMSRAQRAGGREYAELCALAHRQTMAAHKVVRGPGGEPFAFSKENWSNGSMGTVDVFYPAAPYFLALNPELLKAQMTPIFAYAASGRWRWPYAPHDVGTYPLGNGQTYGGGEASEDRQMPVEESGNMLILSYAIAKREGHARYASRFWGSLSLWAEYLLAKGYDPENQLSTDDFAGHLAHNTNLSVKAILGLASYGALCKMRGLDARAQVFRKAASAMARRWIREADDGDHFRLAFDKPGTWSLKYNMVWDDLLGLDLFPEAVEAKEVAHYRKVAQRYGVPLDSRMTYTKLDWISWVAALAEDDESFRALMLPVHRFLHETPDRVPMTDRYWTTTGEWRSYAARSVVGGVFMKLLKESLRGR